MDDEQGPHLHADLEPLAGLLGTWEGEGHGDYPTITPFQYGERIEFGHAGRPFLTYAQRTWHAATGAPMHAETGYLRLPAAPPGTTTTTPRRVELVLAHPFGVVEVEEGDLDRGVLRLVTTTLGRTATAKPVRLVRRELRLDGDRLSYDLWMAHGDTPETHHLHAVLERIT